MPPHWHRPERRTGTFDSVHFDFAPEFEPLLPDERSKERANYEYLLAYVHVSLGSERTDAARGIPPAYVLHFFHGCLDVGTLLKGGAITASWLDNPFQLDVRGDPARNGALLTLHRPGHRPALDQVAVPLNQFCQEVLRVSRRLAQYVKQQYPDEIDDPRRGEPYRRLLSQIAAAEAALQGRKDNSKNKKTRASRR